ncbi:MAG: DUF4872 domain-containing protein [Anaerolineales bacterium]|nr:DUF4872 domain-containing protein [Anaerolineales bacterium]
MTILKNYNQFGGRHWETGSVHNVLAYQNVRALHDGKPLSEAMLLGISGGIAFGYFLFHYQGHDPQLALLTRNTFDPLQTLLERLGVVQTTLQTGNPTKAQANLLAVLESGQPAIVWADMFSLPYNLGWKTNEMMWAMQPLVVFGHDGQRAYIADRSSQAWVVDADRFMQARARIKKDKYRVLSLDLPSIEKLPAAIHNGIWQCIRLFTEKPPRGTRNNFGLAALQHWAKMLTNQRNPQGWACFFPAGPQLFSALLGNRYSPGLHGWVNLWGSGPGAERALYADFLVEAAALLGNPYLKESADLFRRSASAWQQLVDIALPEESDLLKVGRELQAASHKLFTTQGPHAMQEIEANAKQFDALRKQAAQGFPLSQVEADRLYANMSAQVLAINDIEVQAVAALRGAIT